jgi:hypothetical protein
MGVKLGLSTVGEEHRLKVLRITFGPKREEVAGCWRKLHIEELHISFASPNIITVLKSMRWAEHAALMGYNNLVAT